MSRVPLLDLTRQTKVLEPQLQRAVARVLSKGHFILGPEVARFERGFARFCGRRFGVGVASGTDALELALRAFGIGPGHLVATVSFTFIATADAIRHVGAEPVFVDIDPATCTMSPASLRERIGRLSLSDRRRLKAVIPVHLFGHPCDMDAILRIAKRHRLKVIEDAAQAAGARWKGKPVGSFGEAGAFSFFPSKNLGAFGDGGMVVTDSAPMAARLRSLRVHGRREGGDQFDLGRNSRLDELQAAVLNVKLRRLPRWLLSRRRLAHFYNGKLAGLNGVTTPVEAPGARHAFCLYVIRSARRDFLREKLKRAGIATQVYYATPVHRQPVYGGQYRRLKLPETEKACRQVLALPIFPELTRAEQLQICRAVQSALR